MELIIYMVLSYWAARRTIYRNRIMIGSASEIFVRRVVVGFLLGYILIPWAIITLIFGR